MNQALSLYLDGLRFLAAVLVFLSHAKLERFHGEWLGGLGGYGRDAVTIFFVLSGFVIAHVTHTKETDVRSYALSRLSRLYSVVVPALVLTVMLDYSGRWIEPAAYAGSWFADNYPVPRFLVSLLLANEWWFESIRPFTNGPFWSLSYEAAYYLIFGGLVFLNGRKRIAFVLGACLIVGPKIMLLFPIWLMGVATYHALDKLLLTPTVGWLVWIGSIVAFLVFVEGNFAKYLMLETSAWLGEDFVNGQLKYSRFFLGSYIVGILVVLNFIGFTAISRTFTAPLEFFAVPIRYLASFTFSLYLFHYPLLQFFSCFTTNSFVIIVSSFLAVLAVGTYTERRRHVFKKFFAYAFSVVMRLGTVQQKQNTQV